jgi:hypothetical protein
LALPGGSTNNPVWKTLWRLKLPSKVKVFIWRSLHGIVPLNCILANRDIDTSASCPICNQGPEDMRHLLFQCPIAVQLWESLGLLGYITSALCEDRAGSGVLEFLLWKEDNNVPDFDALGFKETIAVACWYLWWLGRQQTHNESIPPPFQRKISVLTITANAAKFNCLISRQEMYLL